MKTFSDIHISPSVIALKKAVFCLWIAIGAGKTSIKNDKNLIHAYYPNTRQIKSTSKADYTSKKLIESF